MNRAAFKASLRRYCERFGVVYTKPRAMPQIVLTRWLTIVEATKWFLEFHALLKGVV
jgi:hypothetical protein